jgi:hypothetical protein
MPLLPAFSRSSSAISTRTGQRSAIPVDTAMNIACKSRSTGKARRARI